MPLDIQLFRAHAGGNPELIKESQRRRFASVELVDEIIEKDEKWRFMTGSIDELKKQRNVIQKLVSTNKKNNNTNNCDEEILKIKKIGDEIIQIENEQKNLKIVIDQLINKIGNIVDDSVPVSKDEDKDNLVVKKWGEIRDPKGFFKKIII
jgi:seryl-tRNA synthetase